MEIVRREEVEMPERDAPADGEVVRAADSAISIGWRWAQIAATIIGFGFMAGVYYFQSVALRNETMEMRKQLTSIEANFNAIARENIGRDKDIEFLKTRQIEDRRDLRGEMGELEARIIRLDNGLAELKAKQ